MVDVDLGRVSGSPFPSHGRKTRRKADCVHDLGRHIKGGISLDEAFLLFLYYVMCLAKLSDRIFDQFRIEELTIASINGTQSTENLMVSSQKHNNKGKEVGK